MIRHEKWLTSMIGELPTVDNVLMVTCGDWDLKTMLPTQCETCKISIPKYFTKWTNLKILCTKYCGFNIRGMTDMLNFYKLELIGRHHSGKLIFLFNHSRN
jgi:ERI1 exoribonuclease 3